MVSKAEKTPSSPPQISYSKAFRQNRERGREGEKGVKERKRGVCESERVSEKKREK